MAKRGAGRTYLDFAAVDLAALLDIPIDKAMRSDMTTLTDYYFDKNYPGVADEPLIPTCNLSNTN